jgi:hypothetical protein
VRLVNCDRSLSTVLKLQTRRDCQILANDLLLVIVNLTLRAIPAK